jgi:isoleucyl-tRNA synthetase
VGDYDKVTDTLDVWFDSGVTHACVLTQRADLKYPADLYLEGSDQHRGWFQSSLLTSVAINARAPYAAVLTHGFTVDAKGRKMSKSLGNDMGLPQKAIKTLGADILRLWVAATDYRAEMSMSEEILTRMTDSYRRMRNTARYLLANLDGFDPIRHLAAPQDMLALDRWALTKADALGRDVQAAYEAFEFHLIYQKLHQFCVADLGGFYLDVLKDRIYTMPTDSAGRRSAQTAMYHILEALVRWLAPILSFTAEEIWRYMPGARADSVLLDRWYDLTALTTAAAPHAAPGRDAAFWEQVLAVREAVKQELEKLRIAGGIGSGLDAEVDLYGDEALLAPLRRLGDEQGDGGELRFVFITSYARLRPLAACPPEAVATEVKGLRIAVAPSGHAKCARCWHHREDVGRHAEHPTLCGRCVQNLGSGERRRYA